MRSPWKAAAIITCVAVSCAVIIAWQIHVRENERKLAEIAQATHARAEQGDAEAQARLAYMYSHGQGVQRDYDEAARWYRKSADQGNARGETGTGYMYYSGEGVLQDFTEAARWYRKAADQGYMWAERYLGDMYYNGYGLQQDYSQAARWYRESADQGDAVAQSYLGGMYSKGEGVPRDSTEADRWYHKAAANGDVYSQRLLGLRGSGLSDSGKFFIAIEALVCYYLFRAYFKPLSPQIEPRDRRALTAGILFLSLMSLRLFASFHGVPRDPAYIAKLFDLAHGTLLGMSITTIASVVWRQSAKKVLVISGIWLVISNFIVVAISLHLVGHIVNPRTLFTLPATLAIEATPIGMAVAAAVLLWFSGRKEHRTEGGFAPTEPSAENGAGV